jgi:cell division protein FtsI (penicillin-binding protein 3)
MATDKVKNEIVVKAMFMYGICLVALLIVIGRVIWLNTSKSGDLSKDAASVIEMYVEGMRGDIRSSDGRILASSMPSYELRWDLSLPRLSENGLFEKNVDSLAECVSKLFGDSTAAHYAASFRKGYAAKNGYLFIKNHVTRSQLLKARTFPIFNLGRMKGGFIVQNNYSRVTPHGELARRAIGYIDKNGGVVGIEKSCNNILAGTNGKLRMTKRAGGGYFPMDSYTGNIEPVDGCDIVSTIDVEIQDIAESAVREVVEKHKASFGLAMVMEVKTGKIRAMVNIGDDRHIGKYSEDVNYAVARRLPPGSTFKLASMIAIMEKTDLGIEDSIYLDGKPYKVQGRDITDDHDIKPGFYTVKQIFERSYNVGMLKLVRNAYPTPADEVEFTGRLGKMNFANTTGVELVGEPIPVFRQAGDPQYWNTGSLEVMSIGYETEFTPLQMLTFYNAVANDGRMMKPMLVEKVMFHGNVKEIRKPETINSSICSKSTISKVKQLLLSVVENGTASNIKMDGFKMAGKTGTAQLIENGKRTGHSASFAGYFPADNPKYSCIVVICKPTQGDIYGRSLAAPVFKTIAESIYTRDRDLHRGTNFNILSYEDKKQLPDFKYGDRAILDRLFSEFNVTVDNVDKAQSLFISNDKEKDKINLYPVSIRRNKMPNVKGMGLRDAMYLLRQQNLKVTVVGRGVVKKQSIQPDTDLNGGEKITIELAVN